MKNKGEVLGKYSKYGLRKETVNHILKYKDYSIFFIVAIYF